MKGQCIPPATAFLLSFLWKQWSCQKPLLVFPHFSNPWTLEERLQNHELVVHLLPCPVSFFWGITVLLLHIQESSETWPHSPFYLDLTFAFFYAWVEPLLVLGMEVSRTAAVNQFYVFTGKRDWQDFLNILAFISNLMWTRNLYFLSTWLAMFRTTYHERKVKQLS